MMAITKFFFKERPTEGIALFRISFILLVLISLLVDVDNIVDFYGPHSLISLDTAREVLSQKNNQLVFIFDNSYAFVNALFIVYGVALIFSMVGLFTRYSLVVAFICMLSLHQRNPWIIGSTEVLMRFMMLYLIFSPCGHSLSMDSLLSKFYPKLKKKKNWSIWSQRIIQMHISLFYLFMAWNHILSEAWIEGNALYYLTRINDLSNLSIPMLLDSITTLKGLTWATILIELTLGVMLWSKTLRAPVIVLAIGHQLLLGSLLVNPFHSSLMIILLLNFLSPELVRAFVHRVSQKIIKEVEASSMGGSLKEKLILALGGPV